MVNVENLYPHYMHMCDELVSMWVTYRYMYIHRCSNFLIWVISAGSPQYYDYYACISYY